MITKGGQTPGLVCLTVAFCIFVICLLVSAFVVISYFILECLLMLI